MNDSRRSAAANVLHNYGWNKMMAGSSPATQMSSRRIVRWEFDVPVAILASLFVLYGIGTASLWRDEAATAVAAASGWRAILETSRHIDAVHAPFYLAEWAWTSVLGISETQLRLLSAVSIVIATVALTMLARLYTSNFGAILCAGVFLLLPAATRYGQEAREGALVMMLVTVATLLLHIAVLSESRGAWVGYAIACAFIPAFNVLAAYILLPHFLFVCRRRLIKTWSISISPLVVIAVLMGLVSHSQRAEMLDVFIGPPKINSFVAYADGLFGSRAIALLFVAISAAFVVSVVKRRQVNEYSWLLAIILLPLPLWLVSHFQNVFLERYGLYALPFFALVTALTLRWRPLLLTFTLVLAAFSFDIVVDHRSPNGHGDNFRAVYTYIEQRALAADAVMVDGWLGRAAMNYYLQKDLADPFDPGDATSEDIRATGGLPCEHGELEAYDRVWYVRSEREGLVGSGQRPDYCDPALELISVIDQDHIRVELYQRLS